jgi:hypothetical protein
MSSSSEIWSKETETTLKNINGPVGNRSRSDSSGDSIAGGSRLRGVENTHSPSLSDSSDQIFYQKPRGNPPGQPPPRVMTVDSTSPSIAISNPQRIRMSTPSSLSSRHPTESYSGDLEGRGRGKENRTAYSSCNWGTHYDLRYV